MSNDYKAFIRSIFGEGEYSYLDEPMYNYYRLYSEEIVNKLNEANKLENLNKFEFSYKESPSVNAFSSCKNYMDKIQITRGVVERSYQLFNSFIVCFPDFKKFDENNSKIGVMFKFQMGEEYGHASYDLIVQIPLKKEQKEIAEILTTIAVKFTILHEIGHLYNGHIAYLNEMKERKIPVSDLEHLTMEMDADAFAITRIVEEIISQFINIKVGTGFYLINYEYDLIKIVAVSIFGVIQLIYSDYGDRKLAGTKQLPVEYRIANALGCIEGNIDRLKLPGIDRKYINECIYSCAVSLNQFYFAVYEKKKDINEFIKYFTEYNSNIDKDIKNTWKSLRVKLHNHARCRLAD
ncbi:hypothetical protein [Clostridium intestinale]|uniref:hypothetical protein n=1 Tax=Clostridium intestinale TaxID=36845 RepID=UPI0028EC5615|nr:hypothetical protein [Clostridium intestinale]